jgi:hypothetical protein
VRTHIPLISQHSWSAIFLYVYTGQVAFTTIGPQDVASSKGKETDNSNSQDERTPSQDFRGRSIPPGVVVLEPCSPKSVYCLVNEVCLDSSGRCGYQYLSRVGRFDWTLRCCLQEHPVPAKREQHRARAVLPLHRKVSHPTTQVVHYSEITSTQPQTHQRNGTRALPI